MRPDPPAQPGKISDSGETTPPRTGPPERRATPAKLPICLLVASAAIYAFFGCLFTFGDVASCFSRTINQEMARAYMSGLSTGTAIVEELSFAAAAAAWAIYTARCPRRSGRGRAAGPWAVFVILTAAASAADAIYWLGRFPLGVSLPPSPFEPVLLCALTIAAGLARFWIWMGACRMAAAGAAPGRSLLLFRALPAFFLVAAATTVLVVIANFQWASTSFASTRAGFADEIVRFFGFWVGMLLDFCNALAYTLGTVMLVGLLMRDR